MSASVIAEVLNAGLCAGCGACQVLAPECIEIAYSADGYLRPRLKADPDPLQEEGIRAVCPGIGQQVIPDGRPDDPMWGPYLGVSVGHAADPDLRHRASSGGALSALLGHLLANKDVDGIVQTAPDETVPYLNRATVSSSPEAVLQASGSRYAPSSPLAALSQYLGRGKRYAIVAKPCDIAALRRLAALDPEIAATFPYMFAFFCAGVPSRRGAEEILAALGAAPAQVEAFQYRGNGWPGRATARLRDGSELSMSYEQAWGAILTRHVQTRCKLCADGAGMAADVACADAWHQDSGGHPSFAEAEGRSLIIARTARGSALLVAARESGFLQDKPFDIRGIDAIQPGQTGRRRALAARLLAFRVLGRRVPIYSGMHVTLMARRNGLPANLRAFLGTLRRLVRGRM